MSGLDKVNTNYQAVCVCGGYGFPFGSASAARIIMVGKALQEAGVGFRLLHCGPSPVPINNQNSGVYEGIPFEYTTCVRRPRNKLVRLLAYAWGLMNLTVHLARVWPDRRFTSIYLYVQAGLMNLYLGGLCQLLGFAVVQEVCEWPAANPTCSAFDRWLYRRRIFKAATGALVISKAIEKRVRERSAEANPSLLIHRLSVLVNAKRFATASPNMSPTEKDVPNFVWCGSWLHDVFFLIRAFAFVKHKGHPCKLTIIGECGAQSGPEILAYASEQGVSPEDIVLAGSVDYLTLASWNKSATALLMPLRNDEQSITRLPNKMGEYLASGRPVITCQIGDLTDFLSDNVNAYVGEPGSEQAFAGKMIEVLEDPDRAERIGAAGQHACFAHLDYRAQSTRLTEFLIHCIERRSTRKDRRQIRYAPIATSQVNNITKEYGAHRDLN